MLRNSFSSNSALSPQHLREEISLLERKDQQIKRLQTELQQERRRADGAVKMLQNFKAIQQKYEEGGDTLRGEVTRRLRAEEDLRKLQARNSYLEEGVRKYLEELRRFGEPGGKEDREKRSKGGEGMGEGDD